MLAQILIFSREIICDSINVCVSAAAKLRIIKGKTQTWLKLVKICPLKGNGIHLQAW